MAGNVKTVNDLNFDTDVLGSDVPVLVDFHATWCGPCKMIAPFVEQLADEYQGRAKVVKVDIDESPNTAAKFGITGVPTVLAIKGGEVVGKQQGAAPKPVLQRLIDGAL